MKSQNHKIKETKSQNHGNHEITLKRMGDSNSY